jgi:hypothetical protein
MIGYPPSTAPILTHPEQPGNERIEQVLLSFKPSLYGDSFAGSLGLPRL